jgi:Family of unknown function (DUF5906)
MKDEKNRGLDVDRTEAPEPQENYDGSSDSKNGAAGQAKSNGGIFTPEELAERHSQYLADQHRRQQQLATNIKIGDEIDDEDTKPIILTLEEMEVRLIWVGKDSYIADSKTGRVRKLANAHQEYAASTHKRKGRKSLALTSWLKSKERIGVDVLAWVPGQPTICTPPEPTEGARLAFNTWRGLTRLEAPPDNWKKRVDPFLEHVTYLVPNKGERERFLQWLAHIVQRPDILPHTSYLMITSTTGIGRNLLASILVRVLRGHAAAGVSLPELLDGKYSGRLSAKVLAIVDEVREGPSQLRYQRRERLKSIITEEHRHINEKYGLQRVEKNCCRWLMFSNHLDALPIDNKDRRVIIIENPTVRKPDKYYATLYKLLDDSAFISSVREYLATLDITGRTGMHHVFNPGEHAPMNDAKKLVRDRLMTELDRRVIDYMEENKKIELTTREAIKSFVKQRIYEISDNHLTHAIEAAGMISPGRRVRVKVKDGFDVTARKQTYRTERHRVVIVRGNWTREKVEALSEGDLRKLLGETDNPDT